MSRYWYKELALASILPFLVLAFPGCGLVFNSFQRAKLLTVGQVEIEPVSSWSVRDTRTGERIQNASGAQVSLGVGPALNLRAKYCMPYYIPFHQDSLRYNPRDGYDPYATHFFGLELKVRAYKDLLSVTAEVGFRRGVRSPDDANVQGGATVLYQFANWALVDITAAQRYLVNFGTATYNPQIPIGFGIGLAGATLVDIFFEPFADRFAIAVEAGVQYSANGIDPTFGVAVVLPRLRLWGDRGGSRRSM